MMFKVETVKILMFQVKISQHFDVSDQNLGLKRSKFQYFMSKFLC